MLTTSAMVISSPWVAERMDQSLLFPKIIDIVLRQSIKSAMSVIERYNLKKRREGSIQKT